MIPRCGAYLINKWLFSRVIKKVSRRESKLCIAAEDYKNKLTERKI